MLGGVLPLTFKRMMANTQFNRILTAMYAFGGGVFLATAITHLLPHALESLEGTTLEKNANGYPIAQTIIVMGYFAVLFLEKVAFPKVHELPCMDEDCSEPHGGYQNYEIHVAGYTLIMISIQ